MEKRAVSRFYLLSFFLSPLREGYPRGRSPIVKRREEVRSYMYVRLILLYGARGKRRLCWTPDAEESEAAAGAAGVVARTEMDSGSKEREIRGGNVVEGGKMEEEGVCVMRRREGKI